MSAEEMRAYLRGLVAKAEEEHPDCEFILIGIGTDRRPQVNHNLPEVEDGYRVMDWLVEQFVDGRVSRRTYEKDEA